MSFGYFRSWMIGSHGSVNGDTVTDELRVTQEILLPPNVVVVMQCNNDVMMGSKQYEKEIIFCHHGIGLIPEKSLQDIAEEIAIEASSNSVKSPEKSPESDERIREAIGLSKEEYNSLKKIDKIWKYNSLFFNSVYNGINRISNLYKEISPVNKLCLYTHHCPNMNLSASRKDTKTLHHGVMRMGESSFKQTTSKTVKQMTLLDFINNITKPTRKRVNTPDFHLVMISACASTHFTKKRFSFHGGLDLNTVKAKYALIKKVSDFIGDPNLVNNYKRVDKKQGINVNTSPVTKRKKLVWDVAR